MSRRKQLWGLLLGGVSAVAVALSAEAFPPSGTPTTTNPGLLAGNGAGSTAIFAFSDAGDESELNLTGFPGNPIFNNLFDNPGDTVDLGALLGPQQFGLNNLSAGQSFLANVPDANGNFHVFYTSNFADFGVGALPAAAANAIAALPAGTSVVFAGWDDRTNGDFDYNDLIFAFSNLTPSAVPEPATLSLLVAGILGVAYARRRR